MLVIDGAVEQVPDAIVRQLKTGARAGGGARRPRRHAPRAGRKTEGGFGLTDFADAEAAPLPGFASPKTCQF